LEGKKRHIVSEGTLRPENKKFRDGNGDTGVGKGKGEVTVQGNGRLQLDGEKKKNHQKKRGGTACSRETEKKMARTGER